MGGGVSTYDSWGMDEAALDGGVWPAGFNGAESTLPTVEDNTEWWGNCAQELGVGLCGFGDCPAPGDDVIMIGGDEQASCCGVGAVDKELVVDAVWVWGVGDVDEPEVVESAVECST